MQEALCSQETRPHRHSERFVGDGRLRLSGRNDARCTGRYVIRRTRAALCHQACAVVFVDRPPSQLPNVCRSSPRRAVSGRTRAGPDAPPERSPGRAANCSPTTRQPGSNGRYADDRRALHLHYPVAYAPLLRRLAPRAGAEVRHPPSAGRTSTSPTAFCGSVARFHGPMGTWSSVNPKPSAHPVTCPSPPRLCRSWVGQGEPSSRAAQGGLDLG
jgi:hypothetical protein